MTYAHVDDKARICLTREVVEQYGEEFVIVPAKGEVILIPVSKNPLKALQEEGKKIPKNLTVKDLKRMIHEEAEKEAMEGLTRRR
ncbi:MAG: AbrB family transcriptional regulator [Candidatus Micrarchaeota archaeon]|nr:AbrB family transcriptional regulator [Candidatus Micrarchaeota archaeon]